jgi:hypothetical protein
LVLNDRLEAGWETPDELADRGTGGGSVGTDRFLADLAEIGESARAVARAELDQLVWRARRSAVRVVAAAGALFFAAAAGAYAAVLSVRGLAGASSALLGVDSWVGELAAGLLVVGALLGFGRLARRAVDRRAVAAANED